jgi:hypothetical protein
MTMRGLPRFRTALCLAAACQRTPAVVSRAQLEDALSAWLVEHDLDARGVACPGDEPLTAGHTFDCECEVHGTTIPVAVTVTDPERGTVEWQPKYLTLPREAVEAQIRASRAFSEQDLTLDCKDAVWVSIPQSQWRCDITDRGDGGRRYVAVVMFLDGEGDNTIKIEPK